MVMKKNAQIKIQQMVFMLLAVTLFFVLVGLFVLRIQFSGLQESAQALNEENAMLLATKLANSPEFSCGESFGESKSNCIDEDKLMALKQNINKYSGFWGIKNIEVIRIFPMSNNLECNNSNYPNCNIIKLTRGEISSEFSNFVALCRKENMEGNIRNKCEIAKILIGY